MGNPKDNKCPAEQTDDKIREIARKLGLTNASLKRIAVLEYLQNHKLEGII